ncbi:MAG: site-specific integrase [Candidatus Bathyarchaeia archaeon]
MAEKESRPEAALREGTTTAPNPETLKGKIVEFAFWMQKEGYKDSTIRPRINYLKTLIKRGANILDPESVKKIISEQKTWGDGIKANYVDAYSCFLQKEGRTWNPPKYKRPRSIPFIPTETELDKLIAGCGRKMSIFLQCLKETGADPGEITPVEWSDINKEARTIVINHPVKGHRSRIITVSADLINRLETLPKTDVRIFNFKYFYQTFYYRRKTLATKLSNSRILKIKFTTFRHWKGTMEYHRTKDILYVQRLLGHVSIQSTLIYIDYETALFKSINDEFHVKVATNVEEACKLIESGFEYVTGEYNDGGKIFRKRK